MFNFKTLVRIINVKVIIVAILAVISTKLSLHYGWSADFPLTIIATAIIFPVVFSIGGAYKRREQALEQYGILKSHASAIYYATRDWPERPNKTSLEKMRGELKNLFVSCRTLFKNPHSEMRKNEKAVYTAFSTLSLTIKSELRDKGLATGEVSRCNQYLSKMFTAFERIKHIYQYRTPRSLRSFSDFFITILPIVYGPYFAHIAQDFSGPLTYVMPILLTFILVSLDNIQDHLENPFDEVGEDDITINSDRFLARLMDVPTATKTKKKTAAKAKKKAPAKTKAVKKSTPKKTTTKKVAAKKTTSKKATTKKKTPSKKKAAAKKKS